MFKIFKTIKDSSIKIKELSKKVEFLESENSKLIKLIEDRDIYTSIGLPFTENYDKRIQLLTEARKRGFFDEENYFIPIDGMWGKTSYFKHHYSNIAWNYGYDKKEDSLRITVIGVKGNVSAGRVCIYKNGEWAELMSDK